MGIIARTGGGSQSAFADLLKVTQMVAHRVTLVTVSNGAVAKSAGVA